MSDDCPWLENKSASDRPSIKQDTRTLFLLITMLKEKDMRDLCFTERQNEIGQQCEIPVTASQNAGNLSYI